MLNNAKPSNIIPLNISLPQDTTFLCGMIQVGAKLEQNSIFLI